MTIKIKGLKLGAIPLCKETMNREIFENIITYANELFELQNDEKKSLLALTDSQALIQSSDKEFNVQYGTIGEGLKDMLEIP